MRIYRLQRLICLVVFCAFAFTPAIFAQKKRKSSSAEDLARICHGHPTYSEAVKEAAKAAWDGKPLNA